MDGVELLLRKDLPDRLPVGQRVAVPGRDDLDPAVALLNLAFEEGVFGGREEGDVVVVLWQFPEEIDGVGGHPAVPGADDAGEDF